MVYIIYIYIYMLYLCLNGRPSDPLTYVCILFYYIVYYI